MVEVAGGGFGMLEYVPVDGSVKCAAAVAGGWDDEVEEEGRGAR